MQLKKILVTTDFSDLARKSFAPAAEIARRFNSELHLVHVLESQPPILYSSPTGAQAYYPETDYRRKYRELLEQTALDPAFEGLRVRPHLLDEGYLHERLPKFQQHQSIDLTVIATHGRTGLGHFLLGSFAEKAVRSSRSPVLVHRAQEGAAGGRPAFAPRRILVPYDFSENARTVFGLLNFLAEAYQSEVRFLHVVEPIPDVATLSWEGIGFNVAAADFEKRLEEATRAARDQLLGVVEKNFRCASFEVISDHGNPFVDIVREARDSGTDLIVMATHGRTGLKHMLLGSVAEKTVRKAPCSVLIVRPEGIEFEQP